MEGIKNLEKYEWLVYLFDGVTLILVGIFFLGTLIGAENSEKTLPTMIASLACIVMSIYFFAESIAVKNRKIFELQI